MTEGCKTIGSVVIEAQEGELAAYGDAHGPDARTTICAAWATLDE